MLRRHRRFLFLPILLLLALPMATMLAGTGPDTADEDRAAAVWPGLPVRGRDWDKFPARVEAWLQDHFGLRQYFVLANGLLREKLGNGNDQVLVGLDGHFYYTTDDTLQQSAGALGRGRWGWIAHTVDMLAEMQAILARQGATLIVASPPNASTIEQAGLPRWARLRHRPTEYDHFLALLAARGIKAVDLRPVLDAAARQTKAYYLHDTHWTPYGALSAFDAVAEADGHPDWAVKLSLIRPASPLRGGDLARLLGVAAVVSEPEQDVDLPAKSDQLLLEGGEFRTFVDTAPHPGPTIMVIGDSFTDTYFLLPLLQKAGRIVFTHARLCGFDWRLVERYHPSEVWYMPVERLIPCAPGKRPVGMPEAR